MKYTLEITAEADQEITDAYLWYESEREGLGENWLSEFDRYCSMITENPFIFPERHNGKRAATMRKFPYLIGYEIVERTIAIQAVFHTSRDPKKLKR